MKVERSESGSQKEYVMLSKKFLPVTAALVGLVACNAPSSSSNNVVPMSTPGESAPIYASNPHNFRLSLTDAPNKDIKSVFVNVHHAQLRVRSADGSKDGWLTVAQGLGEVDLLTLQNGVTLPMADIAMPEGATVTQIRLVLEGEGNYIIKGDESRCDLKTPSAQKSGIKMLLNTGVTVEEGYSYSIIADFDAKKSIVLQGNGGCLLKPVLKLKSASRVELPAPTPTPTPAPTATPAEGGGDDDGTPGDGTAQIDNGNGTGSGTPEEEQIAGEGESTQPDDGTGFEAGGDDGTVETTDPQFFQ